MTSAHKWANESEKSEEEYKVNLKTPYVHDEPSEEKSVPKSPADYLREAADLFESRNPTYGNAYERFGYIMEVMFPDGVTLRTAKEFNRFAIMAHMMNKQMRYANVFDDDSSPDHSMDLTVYAAMLQAIDGE